MAPALPHAPSDFVARARHAVAACLNAGNPNLDQVADQLGLSPRSVQRRLRLAGTSHRRLLDEVRRELALELVADPGRSRRRMARELGYANPRSLWRALRRCAPDVVEQQRVRRHAPNDETPRHDAPTSRDVEQRRFSTTGAQRVKKARHAL